jgi:hypothetical protein
MVLTYLMGRQKRYQNSDPEQIEIGCKQCLRTINRKWHKENHSIRKNLCDAGKTQTVSYGTSYIGTGEVFYVQKYS